MWLGEVIAQGDNYRWADHAGRRGGFGSMVIFDQE